MNNHLNQETVTTLINPNENIKKTNHAEHVSMRSPNHVSSHTSSSQLSNHLKG